MNPSEPPSYLADFAAADRERFIRSARARRRAEWIAWLIVVATCFAIGCAVAFFAWQFNEHAEGQRSEAEKQQKAKEQTRPKFRPEVKPEAVEL